MSQEIPFNKEQFLNECMCGCTKKRQVILDGIEKYKESEPDLAQYLEYYRDDLWNRYLKQKEFHSNRYSLGGKYNKQVASALRAMADKIESSGSHFISHCELPNLPLFSNKDDCVVSIVVDLVSGPLGG